MGITGRTLRRTTALCWLALLAIAVTSAPTANGAAIWRSVCEPPCSAPSPRSFAPVAYDASTKRVVLFGGSGVEGSVLNDTWTWNGVRWTKESPPSAPSQGKYTVMAYDEATQTVVLFDLRGQTWLWDGTAKTWTKQTPATSPPARWHASMAYHRATKKVVLFSGNDFTTDLDRPLGDTWTWDGVAKTWTKENPPVAPPARWQAMMASDPATGSIVLFGGQTRTSATTWRTWEDTWTWNGKTWVQEHPVLSPPARYAGAMTNDDDGQRVVLFGGRDENVLLADTWAWNGAAKTWTLQAAGGPEPRYNPSMAYDAARRSPLLFGGFGGQRPCTETEFPVCTENHWFGDTWLYDQSRLLP